MEKFIDMPPLGRFTLRDEGKTIALGRIMKYKPVQGGAATRVADITKQLEQTKLIEGKGKAEDLVFDMESGEASSKQKVSATIKESNDE